MIEEAKQGKFEVVIFTKLSRFARNAREYLNLSHEMEKHGISLVSIKENIDPTTSTGKMIAGILALFAEWEHETIKEQMYENKMARWRQKRIFNGRPPYAYFWNKEKQQLEINEEEAKVYNLIVDMYLNQKMSFQDIAIKLKKEGIKSKRAHWSSTTISYTLKNSAYYGKYVVNQYIYEDGATGAGTKRTKKRKPDSEHIIFDITPLISKNRWDQIQKQTNFNKLKSKRSNRTDDLILRDVLICGRCGGRVKPKIGNTRKDGTAPRYYACYWASTSKKNLNASGRNNKCSLPYIKYKEIDSDVWANIVIMFNLNRRKAFDNLFNTRKQQKKIDQLKEKIHRLEIELKKKYKSRQVLYDLSEKSNVNIDDLAIKLEKNQDEILNLESTINDTKLEYREFVELIENKKNATKVLHEYKDEMRNIIKEIAELSLQDRKLLVESMLTDNVIVDYQEDSELDGPGGPMTLYNLKWNFDILQRFIDEGKISNFVKNKGTVVKLDKNSTFHPSRYEF